MPELIRVGIVGYGNVGRGVHRAIERNSDMQLTGIFSRDPARVMNELPREQKHLLRGLEDAPIMDLDVDVAILCAGSKEDIFGKEEETERVLSSKGLQELAGKQMLQIGQGPYLAQHFCTVDSFDTHKRIPPYFAVMDSVAKTNGNVSILSAGWDPGTFSLERVLGNAFIPGSERYVFWGPGVSQGHTDALKKVEGVADAIQYTMPKEEALKRVRAGENPKLTTREKHWRDCHVTLKPGADPEKVRQAIVTMKDYYADYDTEVTFETAEQIAERRKEMPHGGFVMTSGETGAGNKASIEYRNKWASNPEATGSILVACARANYRLRRDGKIGAFTMLDIPAAYLSARSREELLKDFM